MVKELVSVVVCLGSFHWQSKIGQRSHLATVKGHRSSRDKVAREGWSTIQYQLSTPCDGRLEVDQKQQTRSRRHNPSPSSHNSEPDQKAVNESTWLCCPCCCLLLTWKPITLNTTGPVLRVFEARVKLAQITSRKQKNT